MGRKRGRRELEYWRRYRLACRAAHEEGTPHLTEHHLREAGCRTHGGHRGRRRRKVQ